MASKSANEFVAMHPPTEEIVAKMEGAKDTSQTENARTNAPRFSHKPDMRLGFGLTYSRSDTGSDSFFGDCLFRRDTNSRADAGTPALPSRTISFAVRLRP